MFKAFYASAELLDGPIIAMAIFMTTFALVSIRMWRKGKNNPTYDHMAMLPLEDNASAEGSAS